MNYNTPWQPVAANEVYQQIPEWFLAAKREEMKASELAVLNNTVEVRTVDYSENAIAITVRDSQGRSIRFFCPKKLLEKSHDNNSPGLLYNRYLHQVVNQYDSSVLGDTLWKTAKLVEWLETHHCTFMKFEEFKASPMYSSFIVD